MSQSLYGLSPETRAELEAIAGEYGHTLEILQRVKCNFKTVSAARRQCYAYLRYVREWSTPQIGALFNRDHSTIVVAMKNIPDPREGKEKLPQLIDPWKKRLGARRIA